MPENEKQVKSRKSPQQEVSTGPSPEPVGEEEEVVAGSAEPVPEPSADVSTAEEASPDPPEAEPAEQKAVQVVVKQKSPSVAQDTPANSGKSAAERMRFRRNAHRRW
jgi:hypothetical protein